MTSRVSRYLALTAAAWGSRVERVKPPLGLVEGCLEEKDQLWSEMTQGERMQVQRAVEQSIKHQGL
jgi:hypothetical protein